MGAPRRRAHEGRAVGIAGQDRHPRALALQGEGRRPGCAPGAEDDHPLALDVDALLERGEHARPVARGALQQPVVHDDGVHASAHRRQLVDLVEVREDVDLVRPRDAEAGQAQGRDRADEGLEGLGLERDVDGVDVARLEGAVVEDRREAAGDVLPEDPVDLRRGGDVPDAVEIGHELHGELAGRRLGPRGGAREGEGRGSA